MITKRIIFLSIYLQLCLSLLIAQNSEFKTQNYHPVTPSAFSFLKYDNIPVSEYTGIPSISIPFYEIQSDGVILPITLSYHASGIRVSQEAGNIGLGWDLNIGGIIIQEINDRDDYDPNVVRKKPDWNQSPIPSLYHQKFTSYRFGSLSADYSANDPIVECLPYYSYRIYSGYQHSIGQPGPYYQDGFIPQYSYYMPVGGVRENLPHSSEIIANHNYDSEPDIFQANFNGHNLKFIRNQNGGQIQILNQGYNGGGYKVFRNSDNYKILVPSGEEYLFELRTVTDSYSANSSKGSTMLQPTSIQWFLTKIITRNKTVIQFNYTQSAIANNFPSFSQIWNKATEASTNGIYSTEEVLGILNTQLSINGLSNTHGFSMESRVFISSISFPTGLVDFQWSDRLDIMGGKKIDRIQVKNPSVIKRLNLNYSYFDASSTGGNKWLVDNATSFGDENLRLKLLSVEDGDNKYIFSYDPTPLPSKRSLAQDFWGYYNGSLSNVSLIPNPTRLNSTQVNDGASLGDNGNNNSANLDYCRAGILIQITYPTGGMVKFNYELNTFDNYWVPDYNSINNIASTGYGLRIKDISYLTKENEVSKKTLYSYFGGKALLPLKLSRQYNVSSLQIYGTTPGELLGSVTHYYITEISGKGFFSMNSLGSGNTVGYDKVERKETDANGVTNGRIETIYFNTPDFISNSANSLSQISASLPPIKNRESPSNGLPKKVLVYDVANRLLKKVENNYGVQLSDINYSARILNYANLYFVAGTEATQRKWVNMPKIMVGYYPIYDLDSKLIQSTITEYDEFNHASMTDVLYSFDSFGQIELKSTKSSKGEYLEERYEHAYSYWQRTGDDKLLQANNWAEITSYEKKRRKSDYYNYMYAFKDLYKFEKQYKNVGSSVVLDKFLVYDQPSLNPLPKEVVYEQYDDNANPTQVFENGLRSSMLWDYQNRYLIAEAKNSNFSDIAYASFEADGLGNWSGINPSYIQTDITAPTGKKIYNLTNGSLTKNVDWQKIYIISYWSKNGPIYISGDIDTKTGRTLNGWTHYEAQGIQGAPEQTTLRISGNAIIDELRLYPKGAQMTTYTYEPLVGITSLSDVNNRIIYYEYDAFNRLSIVRDENKNIVKKYCYNYQGQAESCTQGCTNTSPIWQSTSTALRCKVDASNNNTGEQEQEQRDNNNCSPTYNQLQWVVVGSNTTACPLPAPPTPYARISYENLWSDGYSTYGDVVVRFYSDAGGTVPLNVSNLPVYYTESNTCYWTWNSSVTSNSNAVYIVSGGNLSYQDWVYDPYYGYEYVTCNVDYWLNNDSGYTIIY